MHHTKLSVMGDHTLFFSLFQPSSPDSAPSLAFLFHFFVSLSLLQSASSRGMSSVAASLLNQIQGGRNHNRVSSIFEAIFGELVSLWNHNPKSLAFFSSIHFYCCRKINDSWRSIPLLFNTNRKENSHECRGMAPSFEEVLIKLRISSGNIVQKLGENRSLR